MNGDIYINGEKMKDIDKVRSKIGYITQFSDFYTKSTVSENFNFVADMIYANILSKKEISDIVESIIKQLRLEICRDTIIGNDSIRGLSGGERKRVAIGVELIGNPSLLFMDEPTTGLDAATALEVMELAKILAKQNKTVITTIHQPSFEILDCFDNILTLVDGKIIYWGPPRGIPAYFAEIGLVMPAATNPADFIMRIVNNSDILDTNRKLRRQARKAIESEEYIKLESKLTGDESLKEMNSSKRKKAKISLIAEARK